MAFVGFVATTADGREVRETDGTWDTVPDVGLSRLALVAYHEQPDGTIERETLAFLEGAPGRRFYFFNEAAAGRGGMGFLVAKGIGYVDATEAVEIRFDILPGPVAHGLRAALGALVAATSFIHKLERLFSDRRRSLIRDAVDRAAEVLEETKIEPRVTWRTYPATDFRFHTDTLRRAA